MSPTRYKVSLWTESRASRGPDQTTGVIASAELIESERHKGLYGLKTPLRVRLPSGLSLEVSCERIATGHFHVGVSHDDALHMMGKYAGTFDLRVLPEGHTSYVLSIEALT